MQWLVREKDGREWNTVSLFLLNKSTHCVEEMILFCWELKTTFLYVKKKGGLAKYWQINVPTFSYLLCCTAAYIILLCLCGLNLLHPATLKCTQHYTWAASSVNWANKVIIPHKACISRSWLQSQCINIYPDWRGCLGHLVALCSSPFVFKVINNISYNRFQVVL